MHDPNPGTDSRAPAQPGVAELATLAFTYFAVGVTVTVALVERGVETPTILAAAFFIFSATSELAFLAVDDAGGSLAAAILSGWLVSSRFGLLAGSLGPRLRAGKTHRALAALPALDPNVALAIQQHEPRRVRRVYWRVSAILVGGWWLGTLAGLVVGNVIGDAQRWGLDVVFPAALLAIIAPLLRRRSGAVAGLVGAAVALALLPVLPAGVPILFSVVGAIAGARSGTTL